MTEADPRALAATEAPRNTGGLLALGLDPNRPNADELAAALPQYDRFALIGAGGMGVVWRARQIHLDRTVAIKLLRTELAGDPTFAERFAREAMALARLQHPGIVGVYDYGEALGMFYLVMEHVDGTDLRALLGTGLTSEQALAIVPQLCDALQHAHEEGVVHRDIKPENILVDRRGRVRIADFGLAKLRDTAASRATSSGRVLGTAHYMAPEQIDHPGEVDHRADIFALGVVTYEMLTGKLPIGRFRAPSHLRALDVRLDDVVMKTLEHDRELRFQHVSEVKDRVVALGPAPALVRTTPDEVERRVEAERHLSNRRGAIAFVVSAAVTAAVHFGYSGDVSPEWWNVRLASAFGGSMLGLQWAWSAADANGRGGTAARAAFRIRRRFLEVLLGLGFGAFFAFLVVTNGWSFNNLFIAAFNVVAALVLAAQGWVLAIEAGVPFRIVVGPRWWIPRWEAELDPRARAKAVR